MCNTILKFSSHTADIQYFCFQIHLIHPWPSHYMLFATRCVQQLFLHFTTTETPNTSSTTDKNQLPQCLVKPKLFASFARFLLCCRRISGNTINSATDKVVYHFLWPKVKTECNGIASCHAFQNTLKTIKNRLLFLCRGQRILKREWRRKAWAGMLTKDNKKSIFNKIKWFKYKLSWV